MGSGRGNGKEFGLDPEGRNDKGVRLGSGRAERTGTV